MRGDLKWWSAALLLAACNSGGSGDAGSCPGAATFCGANTAFSAASGTCTAQACTRCPEPADFCGTATTFDVEAELCEGTTCQTPASFCGTATTFDAVSMKCAGGGCPAPATFCGPSTYLDGGVCLAVAVDPAAFCGPGTYLDRTTARCVPGLFAPTPTSGFAAGSESWSIVDLPGAPAAPADYATVLSPLDITWNPLGGVDGGGYISRRDITSNVFFFQAPPLFLGDQSAFRLGRLQFSLRSDASDYLADARVVLIGNGGQVAVAPITAPGTAWTRYTVSLSVATVAWRANSSAGALLTQPQLDALLADLESLRINGEWGSNVTETTGLDDVQLLP
jgi:Laminin B (Domain IV)